MTYHVKKIVKIRKMSLEILQLLFSIEVVENRLENIL